EPVLSALTASLALRLANPERCEVRSGGLVGLEERRLGCASAPGIGVEGLGPAQVVDQHVTGGVVRVRPRASGDRLPGEARAGLVVGEPAILRLALMEADAVG